MKMWRRILFVAVVLIAVCVGTASADTAGSQYPEASISPASGGDTVFYDTLQDALKHVQPGDTVSLDRDAVIKPDFIPDVSCTIMSLGAGYDIYVDMGSETDLLLPCADLRLEGVNVRPADEETPLNLILQGTSLTLNRSKIYGDVHLDETAVLAINGGVYLNAIRGNGRLEMNGNFLAAETIEAASLYVERGTLSCNAKEPIDSFITIHNKPGQSAEDIIFVRNMTFECMEGTADVLTDQGMNPEIKLLKFDYPVKIDTQSMANIALDRNILGTAATPEGQVLVLFGHSKNENNPQYFDYYSAQFAEPADIVCDNSGLKQKVFKAKSVFKIEGTYSVKTIYRDGASVYTREEWADASGRYLCSKNETIVLSSAVGSILPNASGDITITWNPAEGISKKVKFAEMSKRAVVMRVNRLFPYGQYARVIVDEDAMDELGTVYDKLDDNSYRLPYDDYLVLRFQPYKGYRMKRISAENCSMSTHGNGAFKFTWFDDEVSPKVNAEFEEVKINYTLEWPNRNGYVDYDHHHQKLYIGTDPGYYIKDVIQNGVSLGPVTEVQLEDGDDVKVYFGKIGEPEEGTSDSGSSPGTSVSKEKLIAGVKATTIKASTVNVVGTKIRVNWKKSPGYKVDYYQIFRSTKRNSGYGTKPIYTTKTGKATSYTNSKNLKVGIRYYYKVRGVRVIDGKKYYTKWSNKANRTAKYTPQASGKY